MKELFVLFFLLGAGSQSCATEVPQAPTPKAVPAATAAPAPDAVIAAIGSGKYDVVTLNRMRTAVLAALEKAKRAAQQPAPAQAAPATPVPSAKTLSQKRQGPSVESTRTPAKVVQKSTHPTPKKAVRTHVPRRKSGHSIRARRTHARRVHRASNSHTRAHVRVTRQTSRLPSVLQQLADLYPVFGRLDRSKVVLIDKRGTGETLVLFAVKAGSDTKPIDYYSGSLQGRYLNGSLYPEIRGKSSLAQYRAIWTSANSHAPPGTNLVPAGHIPTKVADNIRAYAARS